MDYEYANDEPYEGRILWGRIAVYAGALLFVFFLGNIFGGCGTVPEDEFDAAQDTIRTLAAENTQLEEQIAALGASTQERPRVSPTEEPTGVEGTEGTEGTTSTGEATTYTVVAGDTLFEIAQKVYGDGSKFRLIAEANGLDQDNRLTVGQELTIPPEE